jgi:hypothetical protein
VHLEPGEAEGLAAAGRLASLRLLELQGLHLQRLPGWLAGLTALVQLDASWNRQLGGAVRGGMQEAAEQQGVPPAGGGARHGAGAETAPAGLADGEDQSVVLVAELLAALLQLPQLLFVRLAGCELPDGCLAGVVAAVERRGASLVCLPDKLACAGGGGMVAAG